MTPADLLLWSLAILVAAIALAAVILLALGVVRAFKPQPPKNTDRTIL